MPANENTTDRRRSKPGKGLLGLLSSVAVVVGLNGAVHAADAIAGKAPPPTPVAPAQGLAYRFGDISVAISGTATVGTSIRTTGRDQLLVPPANGNLLGIPAIAVGGVNADDGNLNWSRGKPTSSVVKGFATIDANYKQAVGVFVRAKAWYDWTLATQGVAWGNASGGYLSGNPLSEGGWNPRARSLGVSLQEAYGYAKHKAGAIALEARAGDIVVPWGLPTLIPGGLMFAMNALDYAAYNRPGAQPEEFFVPTPGAFARVGLFDRATLEAFTLFKGPRSVLAGCGTLYAQADWVSSGCNYVVFGANPDPRALASGFFINRDATPTSHDANFGVGATYLAQPLATKFGAYYAHNDYPLPMAAVVTARRAAPVFIPTNPDGRNPYYLEKYPTGVDSLAVNFTTQIKGTTLYGEYVYKPNAPLQYNAADALNGLVSAVAPTTLRALFALSPPGSTIDMFDRRHVGNLTLGARQIVPDFLGAKALVVGAELGAKSVYDLPDKMWRRYGRIDVFGLGPVFTFPNGGCVATTPAYQCSFGGYTSAFAWGYRLTTSLQYDNVFASGLALTPTVGLSHDVKGWSYDGVLSQGRLLLNLKLRADYDKKYFAEVVWNPALHRGSYDAMRDRQVMSVAAGMRF